MLSQNRCRRPAVMSWEDSGVQWWRRGVPLAISILERDKLQCGKCQTGLFFALSQKKKSDKIASTVDWTGESGWMLSAHAICWVSWADSSHTEYVFINPESILNFNKLTCSSRLKELCFPTEFFSLITQGWCWTRPDPAALLRGPLTAWWHLETLSIAGKLKGWTEAYLWHHFGDLGNYGLGI